MEPRYMNENRYSHLVGFRRRPITDDYLEITAEVAFESQVQSLFMEGQEHLKKEEFQSALDTFRELMALILRTVDPHMPIDPNLAKRVVFPMNTELIDTLAAKAAAILQKIPVPVYKFPPALMSEQSILPGPVVEELKPAFESGLQITSYHKEVLEQLEAAQTAISEDNFKVALDHYTTAMEKIPADDKILGASLSHDMAILAEKADYRDKAQELAQQSTQMFEAARLPEAQVQALDTLTGILRRGGKEDLATEQANKAAEIRQKNNINLVFSDGLSTLSENKLISLNQPTKIKVSSRLQTEPGAFNITRAVPLEANLAAISESNLSTAVESTVDAPTLMAIKYVKSTDIQKCINIQGASILKIQLDSNAAANIKSFLQTLRDTQDLGLVTDYKSNQAQMIAYLPHMYFFVIPMAIGDCLAGMGNLDQAAKQYLSVLQYPYINNSYEIVKLWTRLAQVYLDIGDRAYRIAKDDINAYNKVRTAYENIVLINKTLNANSPLYQDPKLASIKARVTNFLAAGDPIAFDDNPAIMSIVLGAFNKLQQIEAGLNFFGMPPNSPPPFSFEYMQNTARFFAQQASQIEQRYIQYMDISENEELRRQQLDQQAEVASQTVILEQRSVDEAEASIAVSEASKNYAEAQYKNADQSKKDFENVRWELLEYAELEAWANASSVDRDDQVKLTISNYSYYNTDSTRRNVVLQDLAYKRTLISHDLEAAKLQRAVDSAEAYKKIAEEQKKQAETRKKIAEKRVEIAKLQEKQAKENRDFLDMREFSANLWRELALQARRLKLRYLDMATEVALLMERAYNAETERKLHVIRSDYSITATDNLMGADQLLADIDYFTYDHITNVKTKKIPVKQVISLADSYAMAFQQLKTTGHCFFQTELTDFDRQHPGMYLCKVRNVELVFIGLSNVVSISGSLRNVGVSRFRGENGTVITRMYPSDVMALSQYDIRQDSLAFRFNPNDLRLFENNGIDTLWQLDLPLHSNDFDYSGILDIQLVLYYDGFFSPSLEQTIITMLPKSDTASRSFSLRMSFFDELYYLKNKGEAKIDFNAAMFPRNQNNFKRTQITLKALGKPSSVGNLKLHLTSSNHGNEILLITDAQGEVNQFTPGQPLGALTNEYMLDTWTLRITAADNPSLVNNGVLDLTGLDDILFFFEYSFDYR